MGGLTFAAMMSGRSGTVRLIPWHEARSSWPVYLTDAEVAWREAVDISNPWDSYILYNDSFPMSFGVDAPATGMIDFRSLIPHELGHSLGWQSFYKSSSDVYYDGLSVFQRQQLPV
ncbi:MAG: hypothetical protein JXR25_09375 [Pontiellaceae bacterium]|nr:hypothetical protein [Pontiellaceae bacterium]MBN2785026.1 hypothetical protein [Pontiellaceae bacterium]